jgi:carboxymethylenebutenolidase
MLNGQRSFPRRPWPASPRPANSRKTQLANEVKAPLLGLYGAPDQVEAMKDRLKAAGKTTKFKIYPGTVHGFFADYRQSFRAEAAQDA